MKIISVIISILLLLTACNNKRILEEIIIEGQVKNIPDGKVYLTEAHAWQIHLDSTECIKGHFIFKIKTDSLFVPYMAAIHFYDSSTSTKVGSLFFRNHMLGNDSMKYSGDAFYLEKGYTTIEGENQSKLNLRVFAGKETEIMYRNEFSAFGYLSNIDSAKRLQRIAFFEREIKKYPYSYFLLQSVFDAKEQYTKYEMKNILSLFEKDVQNSALGHKIETYLVNRTDPGMPYPNLSLLNSEGERQNIIYTKSKLNMLVFWASWCGPCRQEIPLLKEIANEYKGKGLNIVSISMDDNKGNWKKAMGEEKMSWSQYIVDKDKLDLVRTQFNFNAIPLVVFTDVNGKAIKKFCGYEKDQKKNYEAVINKYIEGN